MEEEEGGIGQAMFIMPIVAVLFLVLLGINVLETKRFFASN